MWFARTLNVFCIPILPEFRTFGRKVDNKNPITKFGFSKLLCGWCTRMNMDALGLRIHWRLLWVFLVFRAIFCSTIHFVINSLPNVTTSVLDIWIVKKPIKSIKSVRRSLTTLVCLTFLRPTDRGGLLVNVFITQSHKYDFYEIFNWAWDEESFYINRLWNAIAVEILSRCPILVEVDEDISLVLWISFLEIKYSFEMKCYFIESTPYPIPQTPWWKNKNNFYKSNAQHTRV